MTPLAALDAALRREGVSFLPADRDLLPSLRMELGEAEPLYRVVGDRRFDLPGPWSRRRRVARQSAAAAASVLEVVAPEGVPVILDAYIAAEDDVDVDEARHLLEQAAGAGLECEAREDDGARWWRLSGVIEGSRLDPQQLFLLIARRDLALRPAFPGLLFLAWVDPLLVLSMYDDRGIVVASASQDLVGLLAGRLEAVDGVVAGHEP